MSLSRLFSDRPLRRLRNWLNSVLFYGHWMVGVIDQPIANALNWEAAPPIRWIAPFDRKRYIADPFPWPGSADTIVCEEYDMATKAGRLIACKLDANGVIDEMPIALPIPGHLSFPFLFRRDGHVYMIPESCAAKRLDILRWQEQDGAWTPEAGLFVGKPVADAALFEKDGLFWISYTDVTDDPHDNLHLIYASSLQGPWIPHPANPVRRGKESSRNGGGVFTVDGRYFRPAQDCADIYGGALRIMEITACTPTIYTEKEVTRIAPSSRQYPDGLHSLVAWGDDKCLVDGMRLVFSPRLFWDKILRRAGIKAG